MSLSYQDLQIPSSAVPRRGDKCKHRHVERNCRSKAAPCLGWTGQGASEGPGGEVFVHPNCILAGDTCLSRKDIATGYVTALLAPLRAPVYYLSVAIGAESVCPALFRWCSLPKVEGVADWGAPPHAGTHEHTVMRRGTSFGHARVCQSD